MPVFFENFSDHITKFCGRLRTNNDHQKTFKIKVFLILFRVVNGVISFFLFRCIIIRNDLIRNF